MREQFRSQRGTKQMSEKSENQLVPVITFSEMEKLAHAIATSGLFGLKTKEQAFALMAIAQAEGMHPASAAMQYNIIQGKPALTAESILSRFQKAGGKVEWHEYNDEKVSGTFSHPVGGKVTIEWDMNRAKNAGLAGKDNWKKWPRNMLRARVISEGARMVYPGSTGNFYTPDEVEDFNSPAVKQKPELPQIQKIENMYDEGAVIDTPVQDVFEQKFGESPEDKKIIYQKALSIAEIHYNLKDENVIKEICRGVLTKNPTEKTIDLDLSKSFYEYVKNK